MKKKLQELSGIGESLAQIITTYVETGRSNILDRLQGEVSPEHLFVQVPGIGEQLAQRVSEKLEVETLEDLEQAAHDGRLAEVEGFGPKRIRAVQAGLAGMLKRSNRMAGGWSATEEEPREEKRPIVKTLLDIDAEYRIKAQAGELRKIAPKRFNPDQEAWLPILNTERNGWVFTALYSNTAQAHELDTTP